MQKQTTKNVYTFIKANTVVNETRLIDLLRLEFPWGVGVPDAALRDLIHNTRRSIALEGKL